MENIFKSWITTLFGVGLWGIAIYEMFFDETSDLEPWQFGLLVAGGFALLWMRDSVSKWINDYMASKTGGKKDEPK